MFKKLKFIMFFDSRKFECIDDHVLWFKKQKTYDKNGVYITYSVYECDGMVDGWNLYQVLDSE